MTQRRPQAALSALRSGQRAHRLVTPAISSLHRRSARQPHVREATLEQHFNFDDKHADRVLSLENVAAQPETPPPLLLHQRASRSMRVANTGSPAARDCKSFPRSLLSPVFIGVTFWLH